jgi:TonB-linked SusC/RagA family outer membrane protein
MNQVNRFLKCRTLLLGAILVLLCSSTWAQVTVTGTLVSATDKQPLIGATVFVKGSNNGATTDAKGKYSVKVDNPADAILVVTYMGFLPQEVAVQGRSVVDVELAEDVKQLEEVVVVGYGTMKKRDVTGSVASVKSSDIIGTKSSNAIEALQGRVAGLDMTQSSGQAGATFNVLLRGARSLSGSNDPIYIVDGVDYGSNININPNDIATMDVLKDASTTAIYGSKGSNGVILITTKKGVQGKMVVSFDTYYGYTTPLGKLDFGGSQYFLQEARDLYRLNNKNWTLTDDAIDLNKAILSNNEKVGMNNGTDFDWIGAQMLDHGSQQDYHLTISGGTDKTTYAVSLDNFVQKNYVPNDYLKRYSIKSNIDSKVNKFVEIGNSTLLSYSKNGKGNGIANSNNPLCTPYDASGKLIILPDDRVPFTNPLIDIDDNNTLNQSYLTSIFSTFYLQLNILKGLTFKSSGNVNLIFNRDAYYQRELKDATTNATIRVSNSNILNQSQYRFTWDNVVTYEKDLGKNHFQLTAGSETMYARVERTYEGAQNLTLKNGEWYNITTATSNITLLDPNIDASTGQAYFPLTEDKLQSFFGRLNYGFNGKYLASFTGRYDGSSRLRKHWDFFPSASVAWRISQEDFMKGIRVLSNLKLRFGYGIAGNQSAPIYSSQGGVNVAPLTYEFGQTESVVLGFRNSKNNSPDLGWEKTATANLGLDFGLFADRISGSVELYKSHSYDIIQKRTLPPTSAVPFIYQNVGETESKGIEATLHTVNITGKGFTWTTDFTVSSNDEKITYLVGGVQRDDINKWFVGSPLFVYYDLKKIGIWQSNETTDPVYIASKRSPGQVKFQNQDASNVIDANDRVVLGSPRPKWTGGINSTFTFKGIDLSVFITTRQGQMIQDVAESYWSPDLRENSIVRDYWTPNNPTNAYPGLDPTQTRSGWADGATLQYIDGSYTKIKDITLGYTIPKSISKKVLISSCRIYVSAKNYFVFGKYYSKGKFDPEGVDAFGKTNPNYPNPKMISVGANVTF